MGYDYFFFWKNFYRTKHGAAIFKYKKYWFYLEHNHPDKNEIILIKQRMSKLNEFKCGLKAEKIRACMCSNSGGNYIFKKIKFELMYYQRTSKIINFQI